MEKRRKVAYSPQALRSVLARGSSALALLLASACARQPSLPDVLMITVDTLRADHVSVSGSAWAGTTNLDRLAAQGVSFLRHHTVVGLTGPSHATLFTGLLPSSHGVRLNGQALDPEFDWLPEILRDHGYRTCAFIGSAALSSDYGFARGFETFDEQFQIEQAVDLSAPELYERLAESVIDAYLADLSVSQDRPRFDWLHLFDPHLPHLHPAEAQALESVLERDDVHLPLASEGIPAEMIAQLRSGYLAEVRYVDQQLGRLLDAWDQHEHAGGDLVLFTADHGEGLGEHGYVGHSRLLYQEQLHIPLILRMAGHLPAGIVVEQETSSLTIAATLFELLGITQTGRITGNSLVPYWEAGGEVEAQVVLAEKRQAPGVSRKNPIDAETAAKRVDGYGLDALAIISGNWKFIWVTRGSHELYDLQADPFETRNLVSEHQGVVERFLKIAEHWKAQPKVAPFQGAATPATEKMLEALGYASTE